MYREIRPKLSGLSRFAFFSALTGLVSVWGGSSGHALQYQRVPLNPPAVLILLRGPIIPGDFDRFVEFLQAIPSTDRVTALGLDSSGGNIVEAETIAEAISQQQVAVFVGEGSECSSACFLIFAAGSRRIARPDALIGVHSASEDGKETMGSMAVTTAIARDLGGLGVPPAIIGKLVQTPPGRATWLTPADLASMGVTVLDATSPAPFRRDASPSVNATTRNNAPPPPPSADQQISRPASEPTSRASPTAAPGSGGSRA